MQLIGNCWPNEEQLLLLKAALAEPNIALKAWEEWTTKVNIEDVDVFSYQIMPQIFCHLNQTKKNFSHQGVLKGIYKHTWMNNHILMNHLFKLLTRYNYQGNKPILLMKGGAMLQGFYNNWGCRVIGDFDLLIPQIEFKPFIHFLISQGLKTEDISSIARIKDEDWLPPKNAIPFQDKNCERLFFLDLHVTPLTEMFTHQPTQAIWFERYQTHLYQQKSIHTLSSSDLFFQTIIHGTKFSQVPLFRWIMDAVTILNKAPEDINWEQILATSQEFQLVLQIQQALVFLKTHFATNLSDELIHQVQNLNVSRLNEQEFTQKSKKTSTVKQVIIHHFFHAKRQKKSIYRFLKDYWSLEHYYQLPIAGLKKTYSFFKRKYLHEY
jgi:hypothetical protein